MGQACFVVDRASTTEGVVTTTPNFWDSYVRQNGVTYRAIRFCMVTELGDGQVLGSTPPLQPNVVAKFYPPLELTHPHTV